MANESANAVNALLNANLPPYHVERRAGKRKKVLMNLGGAAAADAAVVPLGGMVTISYTHF